MKASKQPIVSEEIILRWEQSHRPKSHRSKLCDFDGLIREKLEQGYTQKAIAQLVGKLMGHSTTHQNLSHYLKRHPLKGGMVLPLIKQQATDERWQKIHEKDDPNAAAESNEISGIKELKNSLNHLASS